MDVTHSHIHKFVIRERDTDIELTIPQARRIARAKMENMGLCPGSGWDIEAYYHHKLQNTVVVEYTK